VSSSVLIGHGRTADKDDPWIAMLATRFVARGWNALAIDAPGHGERRAPGAEAWPRPEGNEAKAGWAAALDVVRDHVSTDRLAYWGVSMGTALGITLMAGDPRFEAAVLGLMHADWPEPPGRVIRADSARLSTPVLFLANWDDTRAPRAGVFELFDIIGSQDKRLLAFPGDHAELPAESLDYSEDFLARHLS
jgi:pimeloyl-ACP methyl ester carboxylesterase